MQIIFIHVNLSDTESTGILDFFGISGDSTSVRLLCFSLVFIEFGFTGIVSRDEKEEPFPISFLFPSFSHQSWSILPTKFVCGGENGLQIMAFTGEQHGPKFLYEDEISIEGLKVCSGSGSACML
jgi:hypothetical protein